jgi:hypothetical protein
VLLSNVLYPIYTGPASPALPALEQVLSLVRRQAASRLFTDPNYFATKAYFITANQGLDAAHAYTMKKPSDVGDFIAREFYGSGKYTNAAVPLNDVFWDLGVNDNQAGGDRTSILHCAVVSIGAQLAKAFQSDTGHAKTNALAVIKAAKLP